MYVNPCIGNLEFAGSEARVTETIRPTRTLTKTLKITGLEPQSVFPVSLAEVCAATSARVTSRWRAVTRVNQPRSTRQRRSSINTPAQASARLSLPFATFK